MMPPPATIEANAASVQLVNVVVVATIIGAPDAGFDEPLPVDSGVGAGT
jgi:hypothetical protein